MTKHSNRSTYTPARQSIAFVGGSKSLSIFTFDFFPLVASDSTFYFRFIFVHELREGECDRLVRKRFTEGYKCPRATNGGGGFRIE